jgi:glutamate formiminotransferase / formiminotetrahydrofolate cyclodeaminase
MRLVECVPNFSEGRDQAVIDAIADSIRQVSGVQLLDVDPGESTNRTVITFVGSPERIVDAAFQGAAKAYQLIDMTRHSGEHPRLGAVDVVPFIPVSAVTMEECVELARRFAERVSSELGVSVYLYEEAQAREYRKALRDIRAGEYEGLPGRIKTAEWKPDFGPAEFNAKSGATVTGARFFLIAYNVNVLGTNNQAHRLALNVREQGRADQPGRFKAVKGLGWQLDEYHIAQVSMNLDNYRVTPLHEVFEAIKEDARTLRVGIAGSEIVGLVPRDAILAAAEYYIEKEDLFILDERQKVRLVIDRLGLSSLHEFKPEEKIIEYMIDDDSDNALVNKTVRDFVESVGARSAVPGGGSVAALMAAMGAALGAMVGWLTYGKRKYEHLESTMRTHIPVLTRVQQELLATVDRDTAAFDQYMAAFQTKDATAIQEGLKQATLVPFSAMELIDQAWTPLLEIARVGQFSSRSDIEVGGKALEAGLYGCYRNVLINLADSTNNAFREDLVKKAAALMERGRQQFTELQRIVQARTGDVSASSS